MSKPWSETQALGFKTDSEKSQRLERYTMFNIYDRIYGSKAIDSDPPNSFSLYSLFYRHTVHGYAQVHASIYIYTCMMCICRNRTCKMYVIKCLKSIPSMILKRISIHRFNFNIRTDKIQN